MRFPHQPGESSQGQKLAGVEEFAFQDVHPITRALEAFNVLWIVWDRFIGSQVTVRSPIMVSFLGLGNLALCCSSVSTMVDQALCSLSVALSP